MKNKIVICAAVALGCVVMALVDSVLQPGYLLKSVIKVLLFLSLPILVSKMQNLQFSNPFRFNKQALLTGGILAIAAFGIILGASALLHTYLDLSGVAKSLETSAGVTKDNFLFVGTYIALCNSLLEEYFFRNFAFLSLSENSSKTFAYLFSAIAFGVYHAGMLITMVPPLLFILALVSLFLCGLLLNYLNARSKTIWVSWLLHMGANLAINAIGMILLGMI